MILVNHRVVLYYWIHTRMREVKIKLKYKLEGVMLICAISGMHLLMLINVIDGLRAIALPTNDEVGKSFLISYNRQIDTPKSW